MQDKIYEKKIQNLRQQGSHDEADKLQMELNEMRTDSLFGTAASNTPFSSFIAMINQPIIAKEGYELYLIRFEKGTDLYNVLDDVAPVRWRATSPIPVLGIELPKTDASITLFKIRNVSGFIRLKKTHSFHQQSFSEI